MRDWINKSNPEQSLAGLATLFGHAFDTVFGEKHLSWKCFSRSALASLVAFTGLLLLWLALRPSELALFSREIAAGSLWLLAAITMINIVPDYIALLKTRYVIKRMRHLSKGNACVLLIVDAAVSALIGFMMLVIADIAMSLLVSTMFGDTPSYKDSLLPNFLRNREDRDTAEFWVL